MVTNNNITVNFSAEDEERVRQIASDAVAEVRSAIRRSVRPRPWHVATFGRWGTRFVLGAAVIAVISALVSEQIGFAIDAAIIAWLVASIRWYENTIGSR